MIKPSTLTTAEASISGVFICKAFRCRTISSVLLAIQILLKTIGATRDLCNVCRTYDPGVAARRGSQSFYYTFWQRATRHVVTMRNLLTFRHDSASETAWWLASLIDTTYAVGMLTGSFGGRMPSKMLFAGHIRRQRHRMWPAKGSF